MPAVYSTRPAGALFVIVCVLAFNNLATLFAADSVVNDSGHCFFLRSDTGQFSFSPYIIPFFGSIFNSIILQAPGFFRPGPSFFAFLTSLFLSEGYLTFIAYFTLGFNLEYLIFKNR